MVYNRSSTSWLGNEGLWVPLAGGGGGCGGGEGGLEIGTQVISLGCHSGQFAVGTTL